MSNPNFFQEFVVLVRKYCHVGILNCDGLWILASSVKGRETEFLISCNLIWWKLMAYRPLAIVCSDPHKIFLWLIVHRPLLISHNNTRLASKLFGIDLGFSIYICRCTHF